MLKSETRLGIIFIIVLLTLAAVLSLPLYRHLPDAELAFTAEQPVAARGEAFLDGDFVSLIAVGDIMLARKVDRLMRTYGEGYPFENVSEMLSSADITFGNLECPLSDRGTPLPGKQIWFRARPSTAALLKKAGFDVLSLANNHTLDFATEALLDTKRYLEAESICPVGAGRDIQEAREPKIININGLRVGFLAYTDMAEVIWSYQYPRMLRATESEAGAAPLDEEAMVEDISRLSSKTDIIAVSLHWGVEYSHIPFAEQRRLAHRLVDSGADLIVGHHPHVVQGAEHYKHGFIAYSLGNFVFDQNWSTDTREGLILEADLGRLGVMDARLYPVIIRESQPSMEETSWAQKLARDVVEYSRPLETDLEIEEEPLALRPGSV